MITFGLSCFAPRLEKEPAHFSLSISFSFRMSSHHFTVPQHRAPMTSFGFSLGHPSFPGTGHSASSAAAASANSGRANDDPMGGPQVRQMVMMMMRMMMMMMMTTTMTMMMMTTTMMMIRSYLVSSGSSTLLLQLCHCSLQYSSEYSHHDGACGHGVDVTGSTYHL